MNRYDMADDMIILHNAYVSLSDDNGEKMNAERSLFVKLVKAILIWMLIVPFAIVNGMARDYVIEPNFGPRIALPLSGIILSAFIYITAYSLIPKTGGRKVSEYILFGATWFVLTNLFDILMIVARNAPISVFFEMYDITTGNLWSLVVLASLVSPILVAKIRKLTPAERESYYAP